LQLVRERGQWREVTGCPKPQTVEEARKAAPLRAQQEQRIAQLVSRIAPGLKADVLRLVAEGRKIDAILQVRQATGEDLSVAKGVVERLTEAGR
jgi:ribosomal protein L7/L12